MQTTPGAQPRSALATFFTGLLRLILVVLIGGLLGLAIYLGLLNLYRGTVRAAEENQLHIANLETRQASNQAEWQDQLGRYDEQIGNLKEQLGAYEENFTGLESDLAAMQTAVDDLSTQLDDLEELGAQVESLEEMSTYNSTAVAGMALTPDIDQATVTALQQQIHILQAMQLLNRSRLFLMQGNAGSAQEDVQGARQVLDNLLNESTPFQQESITLWIQRLDLALTNLPEMPDLAAEDLEIAWQLLSAGLPGTGTPTPTPVSGTPLPADLTALPQTTTLTFTPLPTHGSPVPPTGSPTPTTSPATATPTALSSVTRTPSRTP
ncbi:MAG: hypothetical protein GYA17_22280 [Chloroflexi bacterium]|nr:hypothetical protein [Chloroflexota bacterium]